jgi:hypothetical protein
VDAAGHSRLEYARQGGPIAIDHAEWLIGFVQGAPKLANAGSAA